MALRFLPELDQSLQPPMPSGGADWGDHGAGLAVLEKYSGALAVPHTDVPPERLKSVPSPWARLLLFEQALYSKRHPVHERIEAEWRGLLGVIALSRYLGLDLTVRAVDVAHGRGAIRHLRAMAPADDKPTVWDHLALIYVDGELIGGTSPRTLVFTGIRPISNGRIPFQQNGRLTDPAIHYERNGDRATLAILREWLEITRSRFDSSQDVMTRLLGDRRGGTGTTPLPRLGTLLALLEDWNAHVNAAAAAIGAPAGGTVERFLPSPIAAAFPQAHPASAAFELLTAAQPGQDIGLENDLHLLEGLGVADPGNTGILMKDGHRYTGTVVLPRGHTRAVKSGRFTLPTTGADVDASLPDLGTYFEPKLLQIVDAVPGETIALQVGGATYLYPLKAEILRYVTPQQLAKWVTASGEVASGINVRIEVPLRSGLTLAHEHRYNGADVYGRDRITTPFLSVWPDFESPDWNHYYYVMRQPQATGTALLFEPWSDSRSSSVDDEAGGLRWGWLEQPASVWVGRYGALNGILLGRPSGHRVSSTGEAWDVSIDFGSTHTRVFRATSGVNGERRSEEVPLRPRVRSLLGHDADLPFVFFPDGDVGLAAEPPSLIWLPLERFAQRDGRDRWLPPDGVMFWKSLHLSPNKAGLRGNLKWHRRDSQERQAFHSYASHLYLSVAAEAAATGARVGSIITAYPSVLPMELRHRHAQEWQDLGRRFHVAVHEPRSESSAVASYFAGEQGATIASNLLAVDIGGSTSDIAIWLQNRRAHSDSVRFAGEVISRLIGVDPKAREAVRQALLVAPFNLSEVGWAGEGSGTNALIFNSLLRSISSNSRFLSDRALLAKNLNEGPGTPGERVVAHVAYLFATLSFLLGLMMRRLDSGADRYDIRFAGKGSEFLHWLDAFGQGAKQTIPQHFFQAGLDAEPAAVEIRPPADHAKQEVGRGLLLTALPDDTPSDERTTFLGETGYHSSEGALPFDAPLNGDTLRTLEAPTRPVEIECLASLSGFVAAFEKHPTARRIGRALGIAPEKLDRTLRDTIHTRLFGPESAYQSIRTGGGAQHAMLLEPFFITEAKVLLEHATGNRDLFAG